MLIYSIRAFALYKLKDSVAKYIHFLGMAMLPIGNVALYGSIYITLAVSIERFLGKSTLINTPGTKSVVRTNVVSLSFSFKMPKPFYELHLESNLRHGL